MSIKQSPRQRVDDDEYIYPHRIGTCCYRKSDDEKMCEQEAVVLLVLQDQKSNQRRIVRCLHHYIQLENNLRGSIPTHQGNYIISRAIPLKQFG